METNLLDRMLNMYQAARTPVTITLQNKIRISGRIRAFDSYVIVLEGQKREILYRHAISHLAAAAPDGTKRAVAANKPSPSKNSIRPAKPAGPKPGVSTPHPPLSASGGETNINNGMKEGLLRWMQEQKAAK